jgi:lysophospholipase L1-like esterase
LEDAATGEILGPDGRPKHDLYIWDRLHPSAKGYALWTSIIKPTLQADLLKGARGRTPGKIVLRVVD